VKIPRLLLVLSLLTPTAGAVSVQTVVHGAPPSASTATLRARSVDKSSPPVEKTIAIPGQVNVGLAAGTWELTVDAPSLWAEPRIVTADGSVSFDLWPSATLEGTIDPKSKAKVASLRVVFRPFRLDSPTAIAPSGETGCVVDGETWRCVVPAGVHNLRFGTPGFAAVYRWGIRADAGGTARVGALELVRGASLVGHVAPRDGLKLDMKEVRISATPRATSTANAYTAVPDTRGFFQITGLPAGEYVVSARTKGMRAEGRTVRVLQDRNAELRSPLVLDTPKSILLAISPALAPDGSPWQVELLADDRDAGRLDVIATGSATREGTWKHEAVAGTYELSVRDRDGGAWWSENVEIGFDDRKVEARLRATSVTGSVKVGDRPVAAKLTFGREGRPHNKTLVADEEGKFAGVIPSAGDDENRWNIDVVADAPPIHRTLERVKPAIGENGELRFDIELPLTTVTGRVVNADGSPGAGALVTLQQSDDHEFQQVFAADDGRFELVGLRTGKYRIGASEGAKSSDVVPFEVPESGTVALELLLREKVSVQGRVISGRSPVIGAEIIAFPRGGIRFTTTSNARSNETGHFNLQLPPGTKTYDLIVTAFGFGVVTARAEVLEGKMVMVPMDQHGGRLEIEIPANTHGWLFHAGGQYPVLTMAQLAGSSIEARDGKQTIVIPEVEQGDYRVCVGERCTSGILAPNGTLTLSLR
jgi:Carboxypeptidase regulatory-like domain